MMRDDDWERWLVQQVSGVLRIEMDPAAQRAGVRVPETIQLTPNEQKANMGYGDATPNNAPPGESALSRGRNGSAGMRPIRLHARHSCGTAMHLRGSHWR
jgi:hypothetical protein